MPSNEHDLIRRIVEEASTNAGHGAQFLPLLVILEVVAALATIWSACVRKKEAVAMIQRAASHPWSVAGAKVKGHIYESLPEPYKSPEFVEEIVRVAAVKLRSSEISLD